MHWFTLNISQPPRTMLEFCPLININCNIYRCNPAFSHFSNSSPHTKVMFLIQLKFQGTHFGAAETLKIHMVSLSTTRWKNQQMKMTCFLTTQKSQGLSTKKKKISLNAVKRQNYFLTMTIQGLKEIFPHSKILLLKIERK